jgi:hypothetical protein
MRAPQPPHPRASPQLDQSPKSLRKFATRFGAATKPSVPPRISRRKRAALHTQRCHD